MDGNEIEVTYFQNGEQVSERVTPEALFARDPAAPPESVPGDAPLVPPDAPPAPSEPSAPPELEPEPPTPEEDDDDAAEEPVGEGKETRSQRYRRRREEELDQVRQEALRERQRADEYWNALREVQRGRPEGVRPPEPVVPPAVGAFLQGDDPQDPEPATVEWDGESDYAQFVQEQARVQARWEARREFRAQQRIAQMQAAQQQQQQQVQTWAQKHQEAAAQRGVRLVPAEQVPVTPTMQDFFVNEPDGVEVSVYLREPEHVAEAHRISTLPPRSQDRALSRLAEKIASATPSASAPGVSRTQTSASPVVTPVQPSAQGNETFDPMDPSSVTDPDYFTKFQKWSQRRDAVRG